MAKNRENLPVPLVIYPLRTVCVAIAIALPRNDRVRWVGKNGKQFHQRRELMLNSSTTFVLDPPEACWCSVGMTQGGGNEPRGSLKGKHREWLFSGSIPHSLRASKETNKNFPDQRVRLSLLRCWPRLRARDQGGAVLDVLHVACRKQLGSFAQVESRLRPTIERTNEGNPGKSWTNCKLKGQMKESQGKLKRNPRHEVEKDSFK